MKSSAQLSSDCLYLDSATLFSQSTCIYAGFQTVSNFSNVTRKVGTVCKIICVRHFIRLFLSVKFLLHMFIFCRTKPPNMNFYNQTYGFLSNPYNPPVPSQTMVIWLCDHNCRSIRSSCRVLEKPLGKLSYTKDPCSRQINIWTHKQSKEACLQVGFTEKSYIKLKNISWES